MTIKLGIHFMFYTIYKITNKINSKIYIGKHQTKDLNDGYMGSGKHLKHSQEKYGIENFEKEILFQFDNEADMNTKEAELVTEEFCLREDTYNLCPGGRGGWGYLNSTGLNRNEWHNQNSDTHMKKMSIKGNEKKKELFETNPEWKEKYSKSLSKSAQIQFEKYGHPFKGKSHSEEWKKRQSLVMKEKQTGSKNSQFGTMWITDGSNNKKMKKDELIPEGWYRGRNRK